MQYGFVVKFATVIDVDADGTKLSISAGGVSVTVGSGSDTVGNFVFLHLCLSSRFAAITTN